MAISLGSRWRFLRHPDRSGFLAMTRFLMINFDFYFCSSFFYPSLRDFTFFCFVHPGINSWAIVLFTFAVLFFPFYLSALFRIPFHICHLGDCFVVDLTFFFVPLCLFFILTLTLQPVRFELIRLPPGQFANYLLHLVNARLNPDPLAWL